MSWWWLFRSGSEEIDGDVAAPPTTHLQPPVTSEDRVLALQRNAGNRAVQRMLGEHVADRSGQPLDAETRARMETAFGRDFADVRVHTDDTAGADAQDVGADAYTTGRDIYFAQGMYAPETTAGQRLLAHELTHVAQHEQTTGAVHGLSDPQDSSEREARNVATALARGERARPIGTAGASIQRDVGWAQRGPLPDPYGTLLLLNSFARKFPEAGKLIYGNPVAMKLVDEAEAAGIQFGGYAEDGPGKATGRAYTIGKTVYVPKARTDPVLAMKSFLFELNNALRASKFAVLDVEAAKGIGGSLTAKQYAYQTVELEVEGMLRLGEIWFETRKKLTEPKWDKYDLQFYLSEYKAFKDGKKSKDNIVKEVLRRVYDSGDLKGKTVEQYYMEAYARLSGGR